MKFIVLKDTDGLDCIIALDFIKHVLDMENIRVITFEDEEIIEVSSTMTDIIYEIKSVNG